METITYKIGHMTIKFKMILHYYAEISGFRYLRYNFTGNSKNSLVCFDILRLFVRS